MSKAESKAEPVTGDNRFPDSDSRETVSGLVSNFSQETSLHGVKFILNSCASKPRKLLWGLIIIAQLIAFVVIIVGQLKHVYTRPLLAKVITRYVHRLPFPAVTVCSPIQGLAHSSLSDFENEVIRNIQNGNKTYFTSLTPEQYARINVNTIYRKRYRSRRLVNACYFGTISCMSHVGKVWSRDMAAGLCYTVNSVHVDEALDNASDNLSPGNEDTPPPLSPLVSVAPGLGAGLYLKMDLGDTDNTGVKIVVHDPNEKIMLMNSEFLILAPGTMNYVGVKVKQNKFLPAPYNAFGDRQCVVMSDDVKHPLVPHGRYTQRACHDACLAHWWEQFCGCLMDVTGKMCDPISLIECSAKLIEAYRTNNLTGYDCDCPFPCEDIVFDTTLSSSPSFQDLPENERKNFLEVNIHFDRLRIESMEQVEDYTSEDVFASVGGQMGLFLGASIITLVEIAELLIRCASRWFLRGFNNRNLAVRN